MTAQVLRIQADPRVLKATVHGILGCARSLDLLNQRELEAIVNDTVESMSAASLSHLAKIAKWMYETIDKEARRRA